jgi:hypothetical protein
MRSSHRVWVLWLLAAGCLGAQDYRAKVQGVVTDATQAAVVGAKITLRNSNTGIESAQLSGAAGQYLFNFVEPGTYIVAAELPGFSKFLQENVLVQVRGDVTVNITLRPGAVLETITVKESAVAVQFNTTTMEITVDRKMLTDLPIVARNPFTLALLDPAVVNRYSTDRNPFFMWSSSSIDVGGSTSRKNDLLLDGAPLMLGEKGSYAPPMDAVQEFTVQQNSVDAEFGHSAGGILSLSMKAGTNEYHGTAYYFGRNPALNAVSNSVSHTPNQIRNHIWGGTIGNPILKNKLFTFTAYEQWRTKDPKNASRTLPTELERAGDFSQSLNGAGGPRLIYDPWSTLFEPGTGRVTRTPFPQNRIPMQRMDPAALRFLKDIWLPTGPGDDATHVNNYRTGYLWFLNYWNFSNRTDWNINEKWKMFARYSRFRTTIDQNNYANSPATPNDNGGIMNSRNIAADTVYTLNSSTVLNFRGSYSALEDDYDAPAAAVGEAGYGQFWPGNPWYKPYIKDAPAIYYLNISVGGAGFGKSSYWIQHPRNYSYHASLRKTQGRHNWKAGMEGREHRGDGQYPNLATFSFAAGLTADTFISPDTRLKGHPWATFLLGALDSSSQAQYIAPQSMAVNFYAGYLQDDLKLNRNITLNLGLRYEYESPPMDDQDRLSRYLDLANPIPEMQGTPPEIPGSVTQYSNVPYRFNGAWVYADSQHRGAYRPDRKVFLPRAGLALRVNDKTALRAGYARYVVPPLVLARTLERITMQGFNASTTAAPVLEGIPGARLSDPFPASNPLILPVGKAYGRYSNLGDAASWDDQDFHSGVNDRFNFSIQRQLPNQLHLDVTYFLNLGHNLPYSKALNMSDPRLSYTYKDALAKTIPNPFFQYLTPEKFPGQLRNQEKVTIGSLLKPYPQYGGLSQTNTHGVLNRYRAVQIRLQRAFSKGYSLLWAYNYNREKSTFFFNAIDQYAERFTFETSDNPRHRMSIAGTYDLPFGKGRARLSHVHPIVNAILGGWSTSSIFLFNSGQFIRFGQMEADGNPKVDHATRDRYFDTSKFRKSPPYTPRMNPYQYEGVTGPKYFNLDTTLSKFFPITERFRLEFKMESYNLTNSFIPKMPNTDVQNSLFGRSTDQANRGREFQYTLRLHF